MTRTTETDPAVVGEQPWADLERLAKAATPGPWVSVIDDTGGQWSGWPLCITPENDDDRSVVRTGGIWPYEWDAKVSKHEAVSTAAFIAAANPVTVLALIAAAKANGELVEALEKIANPPYGLGFNRLRGIARAALAKYATQQSGKAEQ